MDAPDRGVEAPSAGAPERGREGDLVGCTFDGKFLILRLVGVGGFGAVYSARDLSLGCGVAIKILHRDVAADEASLTGFLEEVRRLTRLKHPNVVDWKALAQTADGTPYFVMELLEGRDLLDLLESEKKLAPARAARILLQIVDALRAAHRLPDGECLLHLDLKPSNVFLEPQPGGRAESDWVKVIDFGVSQFLGADVAYIVEPAEYFDELPDDPGQTLRRRAAPGAKLGVAAGSDTVRCAACTPEYCAPEQGAHLLTGEEVVALDERADLYAVGAIGFRMVTGRLPFENRGDARALLTEKLARDPPLVESVAKGVPRRLARFIDRCLARDRERRFRNAEEAYAELDAIAHPRHGRRALAFASIVAALAATSGWLMLPRDAAPHFDLFARDADHERLLTDDDALTLGPQRPDVVLRASGVDLAEGDLVRLVADPKPEAATLDDWLATSLGAGSLRVAGSVAAERASGRVREAVYVEVRRLSLAPRDAPARYSRPFALEWLGPDAVRLDAVDVPRRDGRRLDPEGQRIEVQVDGRPDDVAKIEVSAGGRPLQAKQDESRRDESHGVWRLDLRGLALTQASPPLQIHLFDRAGNEKRATCPLEIVTDPLVFARVPDLSAALRNGERWFVADRRRARLAFTLSTVADVEVELLEAGGRSLGRRALACTKSVDVALADFGDFDPGDRLFKGALEVRAADASYVLRDDAERRGRAHARLEFDCSDARPQLAVELSAPGARSVSLATETPDAERAPWFTASRRIEVHVSRKGSVPLRVTLAVDGRAVAAPRAEAGAGDSEEVALGGASDGQGTFQAELPCAGPHELLLRCWRQIDADDRRRAPDLELRARCVVDETAPRLECRPLAAEERSRSAGAWPAAALLTVDVGVAEKTGMAAPTHVRFEVVRSGRVNSAAATAPLAEGELPAVAVSGEPCELALPLPVAEPPAWPDGRYVLRLLGSDEAGNVAAPVELPFEIANRGPVVELKRPLAEHAWDPDAAGNYELRADVEDPNGVAAVTARLEVVGLAPVEVALAAEGRDEEAAAREWSGRTRIPRSWTRREVTLTFTARDRRGRTSDVSTKREADSITRMAPGTVRVTQGGATLATLRLVRGNRDVPYRFGGRNDEDEKRLFASVGLGSYNRLKISRSWSAEFPAGEIGDYYLDEREATVADFRAFLDDPRGFADATRWPAGAAPDAQRRAALVATLRDLPPDRPVTDVTWNEAAAFASWAGKRLPSFVEWEYALRGGANYRATASGRGVEAGGGDVTPDTKLRDLTGGVSEWSATVSDGFDGANPIRWVNDHRAWFLKPRERASLAEAAEFWVVGASSRRTHGDFACADRQRRDARAPDRGFRCAASFDDVLGMLESGDLQRARFSESSGEGGGR